MGEAIKNRIRRLIANENHKKPLSDAALETALAEEGISVNRRTIAKYREQLGILSSKMRKQMFRTRRRPRPGSNRRFPAVQSRPTEAP